MRLAAPLFLATLAGVATAQQGREELNGLRITTPVGLQRTVGADRSVRFDVGSLQPGQMMSLIILPDEPFAGTAEEWHRALWDSVRGQHTVAQGGQVERIGAFSCTGAELRDQAGTSLFCALYTATGQGKGVGAIVIGTPRIVWDTWAPTLCEAVGRATLLGPPPAPTEVGCLQLVLEPEWTARADAAPGWTLLLPPRVQAPGPGAVYLRGDVPLEATHWATHKELWGALAESSGMKPDPGWTNRETGPGPFVVTIGEWRDKTSNQLAMVRLYTARGASSVAVALLIGTDRGVFDPAVWGLERMLRGGKIKDAQPRLAKPQEAYHVPRGRLTYHADGSTDRQIKDERLVLRDDGVADFCHDQEEGWDAAPARWKVDRDLNEGWFGRWEAKGDKVLVQRQGKLEEYTREGKNLRFGNEVLRPLPNLDGLRLQARFTRKSAPGAPIPFRWFLELHADGTCALEGILWSPVVDGNPVKVPDKGRGTYEIRNWTIYLKLEDGFAQSQDFMIHGEDPKDPQGIWMRGYLYPREK